MTHFLLQQIIFLSVHTPNKLECRVLHRNGEIRNRTPDLLVVRQPCEPLNDHLCLRF